MAGPRPILKALFTSKTRIELLSHFFMHPESSFYLRQLERLLRMPVGQLRYELSNLEQAGLLSSFQEGNQKRYIINREFPLYDELRRIFLKTSGAGDVIRVALSRLDGIELAFVFGSFASGEEHSGSDLDVMVVGSVSDREVSRVLSDVERTLGRPVNYSLYERKEVAKRLKKKDNFIATVFRGPRVLLVGSENNGLLQTPEE